jgi:hypothetical protein
MLYQGKTPGAEADEQFTHFAWVLPSEFLGMKIFTKAGGFAYKNKLRKGLFFPVGPWSLDLHNRDVAAFLTSFGWSGG